MKYIHHNTFSELVEAISRQSWMKARKTGRRTTGKIKVPLNASEMLTKLAEAAAELEGVMRALKDIQAEPMTSVGSGVPKVDLSSIKSHVKWVIKNYYNREMINKLEEYLSGKKTIVRLVVRSQNNLMEVLNSSSSSTDLVRVRQAVEKAWKDHTMLGRIFVHDMGMRGDARGTTQGAQGSLT